MSELLCKKASILILSEIVRRCKRQDFAKSSWVDDSNPSPWQVSRKGQGGRKGQIQQKCFAACVKIPHSHRVYELECTIIVKSCDQCKGGRQGCQTESKHGLHASKFCWVTPLMRLGLSTQQWDSCIFLQQWINCGCCKKFILKCTLCWRCHQVIHLLHFTANDLKLDRMTLSSKSSTRELIR